jgi:VWFA-related protein
MNVGVMASVGRLVSGLALIGIALIGMETAAQEAPTSNSIPPPARVVAVNVIARDSHDQPISDLHVDDFRVTDQGKQQRIIFFHHNEDAVQLTPVGPHEYSNRSGAAAPHALAILFDLMNADLSYRGFGTEEIIRAVGRLKTSSEVYLYLLQNNGTLYPVHPVPGPEDVQKAATADWSQRVQPLLEAAVRQVSGVKNNEEQVPAVRVDAAYRALATLATDMAPVPGQKDILWITQGVPQVIRLTSGQQYDLGPRLQKLATALNRSGVAVNTVDQGNAVETDSKLTLENLASFTGGKSYPTRSVEVAIPEILGSSAGSYLIEYAAPPVDGKFHKIHVNCARKGVRIQFPEGYSAAADVPALPDYRDAAVSGSLDSAGIGMWASVSTKAPGMPHLEIRVDSRDLMPQPQGDGFVVSLNIIFVASTANGKQASRSAVNVKLTRAQIEKPSKDDISISQDLPGGISRVKVVVIDSGSNAIGSLTIPIE